MTHTSPYRIVQESNAKVLEISYELNPNVPSVEDNAYCMADVINILLKTGPVDRISFIQRERYIYDEEQTKFLNELAAILNNLVHEKNVLASEMIGPVQCSRCYPKRYNLLRILAMVELREDPIGAYVHVYEQINKEQDLVTRGEKVCPTCGEGNEVFLDTLNYIFDLLDKSAFINMIRPYLEEYSPDNRHVYSRVFSPLIRPSFLYTRIATKLPETAQEIDSYRIGDTEVVIYKKKGDIRPVYHIIPPEYKLMEDKYTILGEAREIIAKHKPRKTEFVDPERTREVFFNVEKDLLEDLFKSKGIAVDYNKLEQIADILVRYTIGFGIIEILLSDPQIQDITINSPASTNPISIIHAEYGECITNITITPRDAESWATKLRLISGRPLDEANPVLDTDLTLPHARARVAVIQQPLSPSGLAFAFRRHRSKPWTLPLFIENNMISPLGAGLMSFIIDGARTILVAGTRSAGKTSFLSSLMIEIMRSNRVITIEDTLELPIFSLKKLGYDIQSMKVQSVITKAERELSAADGIRTSLRMGDSCLIVGEVRSEEALALYEAMRVGALANVVAGTIHGDSPYGVFDRVVNDLKVPRTSFKATDIIVVCNPVKSASGLKKERRITQITEVRKEWEDDPMAEGAFVNLMEYNPKTDTLEPTDALIQGESEIVKAIASRIREYIGDWDAVWQNILLRKELKEELIKVSKQLKLPELLEAEFVIEANDAFHSITEDVRQETGISDPGRIKEEWKGWLKARLKGNV